MPIDTSGANKALRIFLLISGVLICLGGVGAWAFQNYRFIAGGMLAPDFPLIRRAIIFNFQEAPTAFSLAGAGMIGLNWLVGKALRDFHPSLWIPGGVLLGCGLCLFALGFYATRIEPNLLVVRHERLESSKIRAPLRILHFSDLQSGRMGEFESKVFDRMAALDPDLVIFTGDWLQPAGEASLRSEIPELLEEIDKLEPPLGLYSAFGDADPALFAYPAEIKWRLGMMGFRAAKLTGAFGEIRLHALSLAQSHRSASGGPQVSRWVRAAPPGVFTLVLGHSPNFTLRVDPEARPDLILAGHTHGGQVQLPGLGPLITQSEIPNHIAAGGFFPEHPAGPLNLSSGAGNVRHDKLPRLRFNCPPEIVVIDLVPKRRLPEQED